MQQLVIAISSRALFNLEDAHQVYQEHGVEAYCQHQVKHEKDVLAEGVAFPLVKKLLALNEGTKTPRVAVILLSRNSADTGLRVFNSIKHYGLDITRAAFTGGQSPYKYARPFGAHLFLSSNPDDVSAALNSGLAAATILPSKARESQDEVLRIAFDGDAVLFSDEAERVYQESGLDKFVESEMASADTPLPGGPFKDFLAALHTIQKEFPAEQSPIRTALVTARCAPTHERVIRTLRAWNIRIDEAIFLGGIPKGEFLSAYGADLFVDDQHRHCDTARLYVPTGHVPNGVTNSQPLEEVA